VHVFEREWLVNLILWGNFGRLRDAALDALGGRIEGRTLQIACVYGDLTPRLAARLANGAHLDVVDVLPIQLDNLASKLPRDARVGLIHGDSAALPRPDASYDNALLFFLLHEQPEEVRRATIAEALRVVKPGGRIVIVDYHRPHRMNPLYWPMVAILRPGFRAAQGSLVRRALPDPYRDRVSGPCRKAAHPPAGVGFA
jgi:ubiquinone/menaquinone biosynthesis C-methylase UbiE